MLIDTHVHFGRSPDGGRYTEKDIEKLFKTAPIDYAVVFPIDEPYAGPSYRMINERVAKLAKKNKKIIGFCRLSPRERKASFQELKRALKSGLRGVKIHPRAEKCSPHETDDLIEAIEKAKLPVILHTAHEPYCHPITWEGIFLRHPKISFILAHAGKDAYREAAAVALRCKNVYLDASALSYARTRFLLQKAGPGKIVFASDAPYSHPSLELLKYELLLGDNVSAKKKIFSENAKRILGGIV